MGHDQAIVKTDGDIVVCPFYQLCEGEVHNDLLFSIKKVWNALN